MSAGLDHSWDLTPKQAIALQRDMAGRVRRQGPRLVEIKTVAGVDCAFDRDGRYGYAGVVVYSFPTLEEVRRVGRRSRVVFPYVPGLLSFREAPLALAALDKLERLPDLLIVDGHGIAHPRRFGIASHLGLLLDLPTIGCAKSRLVGAHDMPKHAPGSTAALIHNGEVVGNVLRTRRGVKPVFVSVGHRISLPSATRIIMRCVDTYRIPKPTRQADRFVAELKRK